MYNKEHARLYLIYLLRQGFDFGGGGDSGGGWGDSGGM